MLHPGADRQGLAGEERVQREAAQRRVRMDSRKPSRQWKDAGRVSHLGACTCVPSTRPCNPPCSSLSNPVLRHRLALGQKTRHADHEEFRDVSTCEGSGRRGPRLRLVECEGAPTQVDR